MNKYITIGLIFLFGIILITNVYAMNIKTFLTKWLVVDASLEKTNARLNLMSKIYENNPELSKKNEEYQEGISRILKLTD